MVNSGRRFLLANGDITKPERKRQLVPCSQNGNEMAVFEQTAKKWAFVAKELLPIEGCNYDVITDAKWSSHSGFVTKDSARNFILQVKENIIQENIFSISKNLHYRIR